MTYCHIDSQMIYYHIDSQLRFYHITSQLRFYRIDSHPHVNKDKTFVHLADCGITRQNIRIGLELIRPELDSG
jgi:hypothetical protein